MRFLATLILLTSAISAQSSSMTSPDAQVSLSAQQACAVKCPASDVNCKAACNGVPNPTREDIQKYSDCINKCSTSENAVDQPKLLSCQNNCNALFNNKNGNSHSTHQTVNSTISMSSEGLRSSIILPITAASLLIVPFLY